jgi:hypothetical protein
MKRARHLFDWACLAAIGASVLCACLAVALWDTVVMGRPIEEQLGGSQ